MRLFKKERRLPENAEMRKNWPVKQRAAVRQQLEEAKALTDETEARIKAIKTQTRVMRRRA